MKQKPYILALLLVLAAGGTAVGQTSETNRFLNLNRAIPDGNASGLSDHQTVASSVASIANLRLKLRISGEFNGDLYGYVRLVNGSTTNFCVLLNRAGRTATDAWGYHDAGLDVTFDDSATDGNIHLYQSASIPPAGTPLTGSWRSDGRRADPFTVVDTDSPSTSLSTFIGSNPSGEWTLYLADIDSGATNMLVSWEIEITGGVVPNVTWPTPADIVYGTPLGPTQQNASSGGVPGSFAYDPLPGTVLNSGNAQTLSVTFTPNDLSGYVPVTKTVNLNVLKKDLAVTAVDATKIYGAAVPALTVNCLGLVNGDTEASLDTPHTCSTTATSTSPAGSYPIIVSGATDANYAITFVNGTLTVTAAPLTIAANAQTKVYGAGDPPLTYAVSGLLGSDTAETVLSGSLTRAAGQSVVGSPYAITQGTLAANANYAVAFTGSTLAITPAPLTIAANAQTKVYGAGDPPLTYTVNGLLGSDTAETVLSGSLTRAAGESVVGSPYAITQGTLAANANYTVAFTGSTLAITPTPLTIAANAQTKVYGAGDPSLTYAVSGLLGSDTAETVLSGSLTRAAGESVVGSPYAITQGTLAANANYTVAFTGSTLAITPAPLTITANAQSKVYGASDPVLTYAVSGLQGSDAASAVLSGNLTRVAGESVAGSPYAITQGTLAANANYAINFLGSTLTITPASTTSLIASSINPAAPGQSVTFTLQVSAVPPGAGVPTGSVQFVIDGASVGAPVALSGGIANLSLTSLTAGVHIVSADYAGDGNYTGTSSTLTPPQLINTAPLAAADTILRYPTDDTKVLIATLLSNDSDADSNPIQLFSFNPVSTQGGTVSRDGEWLRYQPPAGFTNDDSFVYTIEDSYHAQATATVQVLATTDAVPSPNLVIANLGNGSFRIRFDGIPGKTYRIEYAETLPVWHPLGSSTANDAGVFEYMDTLPPGTPQRFYRSVYP